MRANCIAVGSRACSPCVRTSTAACAELAAVGALTPAPGIQSRSLMKKSLLDILACPMDKSPARIARRRDERRRGHPGRADLHPVRRGLPDRGPHPQPAAAGLSQAARRRSSGDVSQRTGLIIMLGAAFGFVFFFWGMTRKSYLAVALPVGSRPRRGFRARLLDRLDDVHRRRRRRSTKSPGPKPKLSG